jgi:uncharacterized protein YgiM (DUF1202 family)
MDVAGLVLVLLLGLVPQDSKERKVNVSNAWFLDGPKWSSKPLEKAQDGDVVTVLAVEGKYSKVLVKRNNLTAYIESALLIEPEKFTRNVTDEKEGSKYSGQAAEATRGVNEAMEKEYRSAGGAAVEQSYKELEALMARRLVAGDRARLISRLKEFQQEGKLGESSPVK